MAKDDKELFHNLHVRIDLPLWRRFRTMFPDYGALRLVINRALEDFLDKWQDIDRYLDKCEVIREKREKEKRYGKPKRTE